MTFVGQALSDKIAAGLTLQCDFCRTSFVGQNRCSTPVISGDLSDRLCKCKIRFLDHMVLSDNFPKKFPEDLFCRTSVCRTKSMQRAGALRDFVGQER